MVKSTIIYIQNKTDIGEEKKKCILKALEKQTAKEVISSDDGYYHFCTQCDCEVYKDNEFCGNCGQRLNWNDYKPKFLKERKQYDY